MKNWLKREWLPILCALTAIGWCIFLTVVILGSTAGQSQPKDRPVTHEELRAFEKAQDKRLELRLTRASKDASEATHKQLQELLNSSEDYVDQ